MFAAALLSLVGTTYKAIVTDKLPKRSISFIENKRERTFAHPGNYLFVVQRSKCFFCPTNLYKNFYNAALKYQKYD